MKLSFLHYFSILDSDEDLSAFAYIYIVETIIITKTFLFNTTSFALSFL
jgi:hypothetical protein